MGFYSQSAFRLKLKFLFELFDFNEIKSISVVDLEYMVLCVLNFTYRLLGRTNSKAEEIHITEWLIKYLSPHKRININTLARFCARSAEIKAFAKMSGTFDLEAESEVQEVYDEEKEMEEEERESLGKERKNAEINAKLTWFTAFSQKLTKPKFKKEGISSARVSWVYGIELRRFPAPYVLLEGGEILYAISIKLVIYCRNTHSQRVYSRHSREIQAFTAYTPKCIAASSEG